jgi:hypothetical protein
MSDDDDADHEGSGAANALLSTKDRAQNHAQARRAFRLRPERPDGKRNPAEAAPLRLREALRIGLKVERRDDESLWNKTNMDRAESARLDRSLEACGARMESAAPRLKQNSVIRYERAPPPRT